MIVVDARREELPVHRAARRRLMVAVCREHGVRTSLTEDRDFPRFAGFPTARLAGG